MAGLRCQADHVAHGYDGAAAGEYLVVVGGVLQLTKCRGDDNGFR